MTDNEEFSEAFLSITSGLVSSASTKLDLGVMLAAGTGAKYTIPPEQISSLSISQDFFSSYCDKGTLEINVTEKEYKEIYTNRQNLSVQIMMGVGDSAELTVNAVPTIYKAIIQDYKELDVAVARSSYGSGKGASDRDRRCHLPYEEENLPHDST